MTFDTAAMEIVSHTPAWVWIILVFLLHRGIRACRPRSVPISRMFLVPALFLIWTLYGILTDIHTLATAFLIFGFALVAGGIVGWGIALRLPCAYVDEEINRVWWPGSPVTLVLIIVTFLTKYSLSVYANYHSGVADSMEYCILYTGASGLLDGMFWGLALSQLHMAYGGKKSLPAG